MRIPLILSLLSVLALAACTTMSGDRAGFAGANTLPNNTQPTFPGKLP